MAFPMRFAQGYPVVKGREVVGLSPKPSQNLMPGWSGSLRGGAGTRAPKVQCASSIDDKRKDLKSAPGTEKPKSSTTSPTSPTNSTNSPTNSSTTNFNDAPLLEIVGVPAWVGVVGGRGIEFFWLLLVASFLNEFTNPGADILQGFEPNPEALIIATKFSLPALTVLGVCLIPPLQAREEDESQFQKEALGMIGNTQELRVKPLGKSPSTPPPRLSQELTPEVVLSAVRSLKEYWIRPWKDDLPDQTLDIVSRSMVTLANEILLRGVLFHAIVLELQHLFAEADPANSLLFYERVFAAYNGYPITTVCWWSASAFLIPLVFRRLAVQGEIVRKFVRGSVNYPIRVELLEETAKGKENFRSPKAGSRAEALKSLFSGPQGERAFKKLKQRQKNSSPNQGFRVMVNSTAAAGGTPSSMVNSTAAGGTPLSTAMAPAAFNEATAVLAAGAVAESVEMAKSAAASSAILAVTAEATYRAVFSHMGGGDTPIASSSMESKTATTTATTQTPTPATATASTNGSGSGSGASSTHLPTATTEAASTSSSSSSSIIATGDDASATSATPATTATATQAELQSTSSLSSSDSRGASPSSTTSASSSTSTSTLPDTSGSASSTPQPNTIEAESINPLTMMRMEADKLYMELKLLTSVETLEDQIAARIYMVYTLLGAVAINGSFLITHNLAASFFSAFLLRVMPVLLRQTEEEDEAVAGSA